MPHRYDRPVSEPGPASAQASVTITASCGDVYVLITDLPTMATLTAETNAMEWQRGDSAQPGAVFKGHNNNGGKEWTTECTVTHAEPGRVFAFDVVYVVDAESPVISVSHWRYDIAPVDGGCRVTEQTWDRRPDWFRKPAEQATGVHDRTTANAEHIKLTLDRLKAKAEAGA